MFSNMLRSLFHMRLAAVTAASLLAVALIPATPAQAEGPVDPQDLLPLIQGELQGLLSLRTTMLRCPTLIGGTIGLPEFAGEPGRGGTDVGNRLKSGDRTDAPADLPAQVTFRSTTETFNRRYQFAVRQGTIWYKSNTAETGIDEPWAKLKSDGCFAGKVVGVSADDDELIAIDRDRWIYGMDGALKSSAFFNWSLRWGPPLWTGPGWKLPHGVQTWTWSVLSQVEDKTWTDDAGNAHAVGTGKVSHIWTLSENGRRVTYLDPWLPADSSYELCTPHRGRFRAANLSASGSTVFLIGHHGDMFTRLYDFDIAGADPIFFSYSYADQRGAKKPKIQLPSPAWVQQPKIPGQITDRISIHKVGAGSTHRELRVEGRRGNRTGFWHKDMSAATWKFTATNGALVGNKLDNPSKDTSRQNLAASEDRKYVGNVSGASVTVSNFNVACTPSTVNVRLATGERFALVLHTTDDIRQLQRAQGLDSTPRKLNGAIEIPTSVRASRDPEIQAFISAIGPDRFTTATLDATSSTLSFRVQGWRLNYQR